MAELIHVTTYTKRGAITPSERWPMAVGDTIENLQDKLVHNKWMWRRKESPTSADFLLFVQGAEEPEQVLPPNTVLTDGGVYVVTTRAKDKPEPARKTKAPEPQAAPPEKKSRGRKEKDYGEWMLPGIDIKTEAEFCECLGKIQSNRSLLSRHKSFNDTRRVQELTAKNELLTQKKTDALKSHPEWSVNIGGKAIVDQEAASDKYMSTFAKRLGQLHKDAAKHEGDTMKRMVVAAGVAEEEEKPEPTHAVPALTHAAPTTPVADLGEWEEFQAFRAWKAAQAKSSKPPPTDE